jgi:hypothetical protein
MEKDEIGQLLNEWRVDSSLPPNFDSGVWRRIEKTQTVRVGILISDWFAELFSKPAAAFSYVAVALVLGLAAGQLQAARDVRNAEIQAKTKYIQSIDPYAKSIAR